MGRIFEVLRVDERWSGSRGLPAGIHGLFELVTW